MDMATRMGFIIIGIILLAMGVNNGQGTKIIQCLFCIIIKTLHDLLHIPNALIDTSAYRRKRVLNSEGCLLVRIELTMEIEYGL